MNVVVPFANAAGGPETYHSNIVGTPQRAQSQEAEEAAKRVSKPH